MSDEYQQYEIFLSIMKHVNIVKLLMILKMLRSFSLILVLSGTKQNQKCGRDVITFVLKGQWKRNDAIGRSQSVPSKVVVFGCLA